MEQPDFMSSFAEEFGVRFGLGQAMWRVLPSTVYRWMQTIAEMIVLFFSKSSPK